MKRIRKLLNKAKIDNQVDLTFTKKNSNQFPIEFDSKIFEKNKSGEVFDSIVDKIYDSVEYVDIKEVSDKSIRTLCYLFAMNSQIENGGVIQFVDNGTGNNFNETLESLKEINSSVHIELLEKVKSVFPDNSVSKNWEERRFQIDQINDNNVPKIFNFDAEIFWEELDEIYFGNYENFYNAVIEFVKVYIIRHKKS